MEKPRRGGLTLCVMGVLLIVLIFVSFLLGRYPVSPGPLLGVCLHKLLRGLGNLLAPVFPAAGSWGLTPFWDGNMEAVAWNIRLPRILLSCLVGCCLSTAGASYQGVFQNPMASPDLLGATNGAAFGGALAILLGGSSRIITLSAFCFSILTVAAAFLISRVAGGKRVLTLVLAGIMVGSLFSAGTSFIKLVADPSNQLPEITYWIMGSLSGARWNEVGLAVIPMLIGLLPLLLLRWRVNVLTLGDDEARTMGVNAGRVRLLVIPHLSRKLVGNDYRYLMPASMLFGAAFLLAVDDVSRNLMALEIPIGILTAFVGAPFFIWLITRKGDAF